MVKKMVLNIVYLQDKVVEGPQSAKLNRLSVSEFGINKLIWVMRKSKIQAIAKYKSKMLLEALLPQVTEEIRENTLKCDSNSD